MKKNSILKNVVFALIPVILLYGLLEISFYLATGDSNYRVKLQNALRYLTQKDSDVKSDITFWQGNSLTIRQSPEKNGEEFKILNPGDLTSTEKERVFVVGCSSAYGFGVNYDSTFSNLLEQNSQGHLEVINAAQVGWNSNQLLPVVKRIVDGYTPNTVILYMSNNEWKYWSYNSHTKLSRLCFAIIGAISKRSYSLSYIFYKALIYRSHNNNIQWAAKMGEYKAFNAYYLTGYKYALANPITNYLDFNYEVWQTAKQKRLDNYETNLTEMVQYCKQHQVNVVLLNLHCRYKLAPSWSNPQPVYNHPENKNRITVLTQQIDASLTAGNYTQANLLIDSALAIEPQVSILNYMKGIVLEKEGKNEEAEKYYLLSREYVVGDLGGVSSVNGVTENVAKNTNTTLLNVSQAFDSYEHNRGAYFNEDLVYDDCHPNALGHKLIADLLQDYFQKRQTGK